METNQEVNQTTRFTFILPVPVIDSDPANDHHYDVFIDVWATDREAAWKKLWTKVTGEVP